MSLALAGSAVAGCATAPSQSPWEAARISLQQAQSYLESETPVTEGHRERAIALIRDAITEIEAALRTAS